MKHVTQRFDSFAKAILHGTTEDVQEYLDFGAHIDEIDEYGFSPLIEAILADKREVIELFLERGCLVDFADTCGRTPLYWAADHNDMPLCEFLLQHGADPNSYTIASQPVLVNAILRNQTGLKNCLLKFGAKLTFAQDYINTKLIGHRYELSGKTTIFNNKRSLLDLDFEGFFLEFTVSILRQSLERFINHFAGRNLKPLFPHCHVIIKSLGVAAELMKYQHHMLDLDSLTNRINGLIQYQPLLIPVGYSGHAITFIFYKSVLVKIDRGFLSHTEGSVVIYQIGNLKMVNNEFIRHLLYVLQPKEFVEQTYKEVLGLKEILKLPISKQTVGNCSWANVEAVIPTMLFLLMWNDMIDATHKDLEKMAKHAMFFYQQWSVWDQDVTLSECIQSCVEAEPYRKVTKIDLLASILFQKCDYRSAKDIEYAERIFPLITDPEYDYILKKYLSVFTQDRTTEQGKNIMHLFELCGASFDDWFESDTDDGYHNE